MEQNKIRGKQNWQLLRENREFLNKYLDLVSSDPTEVPTITPLVLNLYDSVDQDTLIYWTLLMSELKRLFHNEEKEMVQILMGRQKWESKKDA